MLYRDDDVNCFTDLTTFMIIQGIFDNHNKIHLAVVEMKDLWDSKGIWYILATHPHIKIGLHGWTHKDYSKMSFDEVCRDFQACLDYWYKHLEEGFGKSAITPMKKIDTYYPTWNRVSDDLKKACDKFGLKLDNREGGDVFNFHWWEALHPNFMPKLEKELASGLVVARA